MANRYKILSTRQYPDIGATSRKIPVSNGTTFVASTETWAVPGTSGNVLTSDGTNWTSAAAAGGGAATILSGNTAVATQNSSTRYWGFSANAGDNSSNTTEDFGYQTIIPRSGTVGNLYVLLSANLAGGGSTVFTIRKNGVDTALTCTIASGANTGNDTTHTFSVAAGDYLTIKEVSTGTVGITKGNVAITIA